FCSLSRVGVVCVGLDYGPLTLTTASKAVCPNVSLVLPVYSRFWPLKAPYSSSRHTLMHTHTHAHNRTPNITHTHATHQSISYTHTHTHTHTHARTQTQRERERENNTDKVYILK